MFRIFLIIIVTQYLGTFAVEMEDYKIELITAMFRHGDRTAVKTYPKDPYNSSHYEPFGYGALTNKGKMREYKIGKMLRNRYVDFLDDTYKPENVESYSTNLDRTIMSSQLVLAGLFPPTPEQIWNKDVYWSPAVIRSKPLEFDIFYIFKLCPEFMTIWKRIKNSNAVRKQFDRHKPFLQYLSKSSGLPDDINTAITLYDTVETQVNLGLAKPKWCTQFVFHKLHEIMELVFKMMVYSNDAKQLLSGPVIKRFLRNIDDSNMANNTKKIYLYSVSDFNINIFLNGHDLSFPFIDYGNTLVIEKLRGNDDQIYIRFLYWSNMEDKMTTLKLKGCNEICPLSKYIDIVKPILPDGDGTECLKKNAKENVDRWIDGLSGIPKHEEEIIQLFTLI